ncbi:MAG: hypothetical protein JSR79_01725 [Proteobacteria bacterium]|nr:hypothetical protein [Pseudomonadota bacterium]
MMKTLGNDRDWASVDGDICRVVKFSPLATISADRIEGQGWNKPYAFVTIESRRFASGAIGVIAHKLDFRHLWMAFYDYGLTDAEEVNIAWTKSTLRGPWKFLSGFAPGLAVMICKAGAYELITDRNCRPDLTGRARWEAEKPIIDLTPEVYQ